MTAPRQVHAGMLVILARRVTQRQHLLRPDRNVEQIYLYCLAEAAHRFGITLYGWIAMSNHQHVIVRDNLGNLPEFMAHLNKMTAKALNAYWRRSENLWSSEQPNVVHLIEAQDSFEKLIYLLANPVAAHLVDRLTDWPGACSYSQNLSGRVKTIERPLGFFRTNGPMPEKVSLRAERLPGFAHLTDHEWSEKVRAAVLAAETEARRIRKESNRRVVGRKGVLETKHTDSPKTPTPRNRLRPHLACRNPKRRALELGKVRAFRAEHRAALLSWIDGKREVLFPHGTYRMKLLGARCRAGPELEAVPQIAAHGAAIRPGARSAAPRKRGSAATAQKTA